jgi:hypothetical protein
LRIVPPSTRTFCITGLLTFGTPLDHQSRFLVNRTDYALRIIGYIAMHHSFDNQKTGIPGPHQMKLNSQLPHGKTAKPPSYPPCSQPFR